MYNFKRLNSKPFQKAGTQLTEDNLYWKQFGSPLLIKEFGPIDHIDFSPIQPHHFAVTCSVRIQVYNPITKIVYRNLSRFRENAYGATFRSDGRLLCAGGEETNVKLFDVASRGLLRLFKGHSAAVHRTCFFNNQPQIVSFSDDHSVKLWDIPTETQLLSYSGHEDYVRAGATCQAMPDVILSGGYDNTVKMFDSRANEVVFSVNHGNPIESLLFLPSGGVFLSAGGTEIKIWDVVAGGKQAGSLSHHHKTITCMCMASDNTRFLSGSLDRQVKVYDISTFRVVHSMSYSNAVLSLGVSKNDDTLVAGLNDGLVCVSRKSEDKQVDGEVTQASSNRKKTREVSYRYSVHSHVSSVDQEIKDDQPEKFSKIDVCLRKFQFSRALDMALLPFVTNRRPDITTSLLHELIRRDVLQNALAGRDEKSLLRILRFFQKTIVELQFRRIIIDAINVFIDVYGHEIGGMSTEVINTFRTLAKQVEDSTSCSSEMIQTENYINMVLASWTVSDMELSNETLNLNPSSSAKKNFVVKIK